jgi:hypothetical protein
LATNAEYSYRNDSFAISFSASALQALARFLRS